MIFGLSGLSYHFETTLHDTIPLEEMVGDLCSLSESRPVMRRDSVTAMLGIQSDYEPGLHTPAAGNNCSSNDVTTVTVIALPMSAPNCARVSMEVS